MSFKSRVLIAAAVIGAIVLIGAREFQSACAPPPSKADSHGHAHGESEGHADESFGTKVCEAGLLAALSETFGGASGSAKSEPAAGKEHDHAEGGGHDHDAKEAGGDGHGHAHGAGGEEKEQEGLIKLSADQIEAAGIDMAPVASGKLLAEVSVPGRIALNANAQARIVPKLTGAVSEIFKQLGEPVKKGELLARVESKEMADAKADYLASWRAHELAVSTFEREERLWKLKVTAEQDYLTARNAEQSAKIKLDQAHQRLHAIGLSHEEIEAVPTLDVEDGYRFYEIRSPIDGRVTARDLVLGQIVGTDKEIFTIADLAKVWVEMAVPPSDLSFAREGQEVRVEAGKHTATAKIIALSPVIDRETRSAKAIAELDNADGSWRLGDYVNARLRSGEQEADLLVPRGAIQTVNGKKAVFVMDRGGFRARPVTTGREDSEHVEILSGLEFGETIATENTFTLKAELGKAEAEHEH